MSDKRPNDTALLAAIDLGSNSFHMLVARASHGEMRPVAALGEKVQLAAGLSSGRLRSDAIARGLDCLARFRQVLDTLKPDTVRVVGTNTLRAAKNAGEFTSAASVLLGRPVEVISGREEARLIYLGVAHTQADDDRARLVVDIGGGSTELVIGQRFDPRLLESLHMGCVSYRERFFPGGRIGRKRFDQAYQSAYLEVLNVRENYRTRGWVDCVGSSGTLLAILEVLQAAHGADQTITADGLRKLRAEVANFRDLDEITAKLTILKESRHAIFPAGLAICCAVFDALDISAMSVSSGALREGVVYDLMGRNEHEDVRERTLSALAARYQIDQQNAERVALMAAYLFDNARIGWELAEADGEMLCRAARLHEIGLAISHSQFHKHGHYLVQNADLPGFSLSEQKVMALLIRCHRRKFPLDLFTEWPAEQRPRLQRLAVLLRLAVLFKYVAPVDGLPHFDLAVGANSCRLDFTPGWLQRHPLTMAELGMERDYLRSAGYALEFA